MQQHSRSEVCKECGTKFLYLTNLTEADITALERIFPVVAEDLKNFISEKRKKGYAIITLWENED